MRIIRRLWLKTKDEGHVYIIAHEVFHCLRRIKQIEGKNVWLDAYAYAEEMLRGFRVHWDGS